MTRKEQTQAVIDGGDVAGMLDLIEMRCEKGQGFLLGRPVSADEAGPIIRSAMGGRNNAGTEFPPQDASAREA